MAAQQNKNPHHSLTVRGIDYSLRQLDFSDVDVLHDLDILCFKPERAFTTGYFILLFFYDDAFGWCLEQAGTIIAFILLTKKRYNANIATIDIHPDYRRRGIGMALIQFAEEQLKADGIKSLTLQVETDNVPALELYEKLNFEKIKTIPDYYVDADAYLMRKLLR
jgi:ribosomal-protein-alanine N-acetyltransferase